MELEDEHWRLCRTTVVRGVAGELEDENWLPQLTRTRTQTETHIHMDIDTHTETHTLPQLTRFDTSHCTRNRELALRLPTR